MQWKMGVHTAHHIFSKHFVCTLSFNYCCLVKRKNANKLKHQTLPLMEATRPASGKFNVHTLTKGLQTALITWLFVSLCLNFRRGTRRPH